MNNDSHIAKYGLKKLRRKPSQKMYQRGGKKKKNLKT